MTNLPDDNRNLLPIHTMNFFEKRGGEIIGHATNKNEAAEIARAWGEKTGNRGNGHYENVVVGVELLQDESGKWFKVRRRTSPGFI